MKAIKLLGILLAIYVAVVVVFESLLGYFQPEAPDTVVITTIDAQANSHDRVLSGLQSGGQFYVAVNHWPRAWYHRLLENPEVRITRDGATKRYRAVPVSGTERAALEEEYAAGLVFRILTGFPPRHFIRLEPLGD